MPHKPDNLSSEPTSKLDAVVSIIVMHTYGERRDGGRIT